MVPGLRETWPTGEFRSGQDGTCALSPPSRAAASRGSVVHINNKPPTERRGMPSCQPYLSMPPDTNNIPFRPGDDTATIIDRDNGPPVTPRSKGSPKEGRVPTNNYHDPALFIQPVREGAHRHSKGFPQSRSRRKPVFPDIVDRL